MAPEAFKQWINKRPTDNHSVVALGTGLNYIPHTPDTVIRECVARDCAVLLFSLTHDNKQNAEMTPEMLLDMMQDVREEATKHAIDARIDNRVLITHSLPGLITQLDEESDWNRIVSHGPPYEVTPFYRNKWTRSAIRGLGRLGVPIYIWNENFPGEDYLAKTRMHRFVPPQIYDASLMSKDRLQEQCLPKDGPPTLVIHDPLDSVSCHDGTRELMERSDLSEQWQFQSITRTSTKEDLVNHHDTTDPKMLGKWAKRVNKARNGFLKLLKNPRMNPQKLSLGSLHRSV
ncbi:MAG: hypothetical protein QF442_03260 [Candidatus Peribacteraceae bacterium]|jgi:hypothetical protein|nr:hypothetical protein [Candidatus Peribacteraceae bacterium]